jgi:small subunit ribosomal protein S4
MRITSKYKVCRRLGSEVFDKCQNQKYILSESKRKNSTKKGGRRRNLSLYNIQLLEKQKVRVSYGLSEKQFRKYIDIAIAKKGSSSVDELYKLLETRLDNIVYRLNLAPSRAQARQMVSHGHFVINGKRVKIPSYQITQKDHIVVREGSINKKIFSDLNENKIEIQSIPNWLSFDLKKKEAQIVNMPKHDSTTLFNLNSVIEFYSR